MKIRKKGFLIAILEVCFQFLFAFEQNERAVPLGLLIPHIEQEMFKLIPSGQKYMLSISLPNGSSRNDVVELRESNTQNPELYVNGEIINTYRKGVLIITYEAGKNGYYAKYRYEVPMFFALSPNALKSAAG